MAFTYPERKLERKKEGEKKGGRGGEGEKTTHHIHRFASELHTLQ
jgi:hypothetical protein